MSSHLESRSHRVWGERRYTTFGTWAGPAVPARELHMLQALAASARMGSQDPAIVAFLMAKLRRLGRGIHFLGERTPETAVGHHETRAVAVAFLEGMTDWSIVGGQILPEPEHHRPLLSLLAASQITSEEAIRLFAAGLEAAGIPALLMAVLPHRAPHDHEPVRFESMAVLYPKMSAPLGDRPPSASDVWTPVDPSLATAGEISRCFRVPRPTGLTLIMDVRLEPVRVIRWDKENAS